MEEARRRPNVIITGTPGVGKSVHCQQLASDRPDLKIMSINDIVKEKECHEGWDNEKDCWIVDEDKLLDTIEEDVKNGGYIIDWHACDVFPKSWIDLVVVLRCQETNILWDRLKARNYNEAKLQENLDAEIFGVLSEEAREGFDEEVVVELNSESAVDIDSNCERIVSWVESWEKQHA